MFGSREFRAIFQGRAKKHLRTPDLTVTDARRGHVLSIY